MKKSKNTGMQSHSTKEIEAAWQKEIKRRVKDFESGKSKPLPAEEVFRRLRKAAAKRS